MRMASEQAALRWLAREPLLHMDMSETICRGQAELVYAGDDGVLLRERRSGLYMLSAAADSPAAQPLLHSGCEMLTVHQSHWLDWCAEKLGLRGHSTCYQAVYLSETPPPLDTELRFRPLGEADLDLVTAHYTLEDRETVRAELASGEVFAAYTPSGELVGFAGSHLEGSLGLLEILPAHRRRGYGAALETYVLRRTLALGRTPYGHIFHDNTASLALQKALGLTLAADFIYWVY